MLEARFIAISMPEPDIAAFTLESRDGIKASFRQAGFNAFAQRAIDLVAPREPISDTDLLLNRWFLLHPADDGITF